MGLAKSGKQQHSPKPGPKLAIHIYEIGYGKTVPPGWVVSFKDGNKHNYQLANLEIKPGPQAFRLTKPARRPRDHYSKPIPLRKPPAHRVVYQQAYGTIPKGWHIHHIDVRHKNNELENLIAIPEWFHNLIHKTRATTRRRPMSRQALIELLCRTEGVQVPEDCHGHAALQNALRSEKLQAALDNKPTLVQIIDERRGIAFTRYVAV